MQNIWIVIVMGMMGMKWLIIIMKVILIINVWIVHISISKFKMLGFLFKFGMILICDHFILYRVIGLILYCIIGIGSVEYIYLHGGSDGA